MSGLARRAGRILDESGRPILWSVAEGRRGRRWRWTVGDRRGGVDVSHVLETGPDGRFTRIESVSGTGLLTLHREVDGSVQGNRVTAAGVHHLSMEAPAPELVIVGRAGIGVAAFVAGLGDRAGPVGGRIPVDVLEISDDLAVHVASCAVRSGRAGEWEVRTTLAARMAVLGPDGLPANGGAEGVSWPLERPT